MSLFGDLFKSDEAIRDEVEILRKNVNNNMIGDGNSLPLTPETLVKPADSIGNNAILDDPYYDYSQNNMIYKSKHSRISNRTLKDVSVRDWLVSSIIQTRVDTMTMFAQPQRKPQKLEMGFKISKKNGDWDLTEAEKQEVASIEDFILNCGNTTRVVKDDEMNFGTFLKKTTRDALTFGHIAVEKVLTPKGAFHRFRPVPGESVYRVQPTTDAKTINQEVDNSRKTYLASRKNASNDITKQHIKSPDGDYKYVQMSVNNIVLAGFNDSDMAFKLFNPQNFQDSLGYCYSPLELSVVNITNHLNVENYNSNFFTHGYAARGILHLKGNVTQSTLGNFRRQFYNQINGSQNAWRTPIVAGLESVEWVPLSGTNKEMEYLQYNDHLMRIICTQFQIDPMELGLEYLSKGGIGGGSRAGETGEDKVNSSRERGLRPLLTFFEDLINQDILPAIDPAYAKKYKFSFTGYTSESPQTNVALLQSEMTVYSSMNDLLKDAYKFPLNDKIKLADLPLNQSFWALVEKMYTKGEIRELFLGDEGASKRPELAYFPGDPAFMGWQQLMVTIEQQKQQAATQQQQQEQQQQLVAQQQQKQSQLTDSEQAREQEKHDMEKEKHEDEMNRQHAQYRDALNNETAYETAKNIGLGSKPLHIGGKIISNPINKK